MKPLTGKCHDLGWSTINKHHIDILPGHQLFSSYTCTLKALFATFYHFAYTYILVHLVIAGSASHFISLETIVQLRPKLYSCLLTIAAHLHFLFTKEVTEANVRDF